MRTFEIIFVLIFILGIGLIIVFVFRDPILTLKSLLRGFKAGGNWQYRVLFFPIWGPLWLIDRIFGLKLYNKDFEEASSVNNILFKDFDKYILIDTEDINQIERILNDFNNDFAPNDYNYSLNDVEIRISQLKKDTVLGIDKNIQFDSFNLLIQYIDNSAPQNRVYHVKGILINKINRIDSYFVFFDSAYPLKLIGKTYNNKKMYVDINPNNESIERIYLNSNIDFFRKFDFDRFIAEIDKLKFRELKIMPSAQHRV